VYLSIRKKFQLRGGFLPNFSRTVSIHAVPDGFPADFSRSLMTKLDLSQSMVRGICMSQI